MKRGLLCIAAALVAGALWLASLRNYDAADAVEENGVLLYLRKDHGAAFASTYRWDGTGDAIDYVIPDTVQGVKVTAIGGLTGELKKAPTAGLAITMPETYRGAERAHYTMPSGAVEITSTSAAMSARSSRTAACRRPPVTLATTRASAAISSPLCGR